MLKNINKKIIIIISIITVSGFGHYTQAETHIPGGIIATDTTWTASSSPYILDGYTSVASGHTLTVEPGVTIDTHLTGDSRPALDVENATIIMQGTEKNPIIIKDLWGLSLFRATGTLAHVKMSGVEGGVGLYESDVDISYSFFKDARMAFWINGGLTMISSSSISGYESGLFIQNSAPVLMMNNPSNHSFVGNYGIGGIGNALINYNDPFSATVIVTNSSFPDISTVAINNFGAKLENTVIAEGDWWGSPTDPSTMLTSRIIGPVDYTPWLLHEPDLTEPEKIICCSNILFIPGLESTRLYRDEKGLFGIGTSTNTLWEPNRNDDVRKLFLNTNGSSSDTSVYSGDPIDNAWGYDIYGYFMKFLDSLVTSGSINSWQGYGYDWRKPIPDVVMNSEKKSAMLATTTISLIETVTNLAKSSKTGKITIVAHSNGGLVAKYLVKILSDQGRSNLIDSVISVAVPNLGTPEAIPAMLHGDDQELAYGLLLKTNVARQLAQNMPSAYSLLPSAGYYSKVPGSTISFATGTPSIINNGSYPKSILSFADMSAFITDSNKTNTRVASSSSDIVDPIKGNASLIASAGNLHALLDNFTWPSSIINWAIDGWNVLTTKGIIYQKNGHDTAKTNMGDGTVVAKSAIDGSVNVASIDLKEADNGKIEHANILDSQAAQNTIKDIVQNKSDQILQIPSVTIGEPDYSKESTYLVLSTHSPVQPHVYDEQGNHTGEIAPPPDTEDLYTAYEKNIPGSSFETMSKTDTDYDSYIYLPDDGKKYSVVIQGTGLGSFTFDIDRMRGGETLNHAEYAGLPVTPLTMASTTVQISSSSAFTNSLVPLSVDVNGDGQTDITASHDATTTMTTDGYLDILKKTCDTLNRPGKNRIGAYTYCRNLLKRIDVMKDRIKNGKAKNIPKNIRDMDQYDKHRDWKKIGDSDRQAIESMIDGFIAQFE